MILVLIVTALTSIIWLVIAKCYEGKKQHSYGYLIGAGLLGGAFAVGCTLVLNAVFSELLASIVRGVRNGNAMLLLLSAYSTGFKEEIAKFTGMLLIWKWSRYQPSHALDIIILGIVVSMGFEAWENILYGYRYSWGVVIGRALIPGHMIYGAIWSYGLKEYIEDKGNWVGSQILVASYILAALTHGTFNFMLSLEKSYSITAAVIFAWVSTVIIHVVLFKLKPEKEGLAWINSPIGELAASRNSTRGPITEREGSPIRQGITGHRGQPAMLGRAVYMTHDTLNKVDNLRAGKKTVGMKKPMTRNSYIKGVIEGLFEASKHRQLSLNFRDFDNRKRGAEPSAFDGRCSVTLDYQTLRQLDEIRRAAEAQLGTRFSRAQFMSGVVTQLYKTNGK